MINYENHVTESGLADLRLRSSSPFEAEALCDLRDRSSAHSKSECTVQCPTSVDGKGRTVDPCAGDSRVPSTTVCQLCTSASRAYRPAPPGRPRRERDHVGLLFVPKAWAE